MISKAKGYDNAEKAEAREAVWSNIMRYAHGMGIKSPKAAILCGPRRHEVDMAVKHGVDLKDILNIEMKPATMSNFTRSFTTSERTHLKTFRGLISDAVVNLVKNKEQLQVAHFDFCDPIETLNKNSPRVEIEHFIASGVMPRGVLAITVQNGRVAGFEGEEIRLKMLDFFRAVLRELLILMISVM